MTAQDIREMSPEEIRKELRDTREKLLNLRVRKRIGQVDNPSEIRLLRRNIARMETLLMEKKIAEQKAAEEKAKAEAAESAA